MEQKEQWRYRNDSESECEIRNPFQNFKFSNYLYEEFSPSTRHQEEGEAAQDNGPFRNRVYKFLSIPQYFESFMAYGLLQCLDHLLVIYTFLPLRCFVTYLTLLVFVLRSIFGLFIPRIRPLGRYQLHAVDARDLVKFSFVCLCTLFLYTFDSSIAYHEIRTQSVIKIYIFFNLLEVADRLLSAVNLDAIDDILFTVKAKLMSGRPEASGSRPACSGDNPQPPGSNPSPASASTSVTWGSFILQYTFALLCVAAHCLLLLAQVTTLNVAFNSQNRSLLTVMISNNFIELKSNVFRKMGKSNLFQIACADVRERFHYSVWLFIIVCRNMSATGWQSDDFLGFLPDIFLIFGAEVAVDWVKHAFISKFNVIPSDVYEEYTVSIAYDLLLCRQGKNSADYFELLARRMGLTPISLSCLINVMLIQTVRSSWLFLIISVAVPLMFLVKLLAHLLLLRLAYNHVHAYTVAMTTKLSTGAAAAAAGGGTSDMASSAGAQGAPVSSTDAMRYATSAAAASIPTDTVKSQKRGVFFHPYTGYDLPTRDDGQFAMPHPVIPQRSHSDSTCLSIPQMAEAGGSLRLGIGAGGQPSDHSSLRGAGGSAEEFASLTSVPSTFTTGVGSSGSKRGILKPTVPAAAIDLSVAAGFASLFYDEVSNTSYKTATQSWLDSSDMHVRRRKNAVPLNSLSMESSEANTLESLSQHDADSEGPFGPAEEGHVAFIGAECFKVHHFDQPLINRHLRGFSEATSTPARWKRGQMPLRRCCSLDSLRLWQPCRTLSPRVMASEKGDEAKQLQQEPKASAPCAHRSNRRRVHTENEVSTVLILEQLSSLLNDESAHLEDAADDDSSDMNGEVEQEDRRPESSADAASSLTEPVKQPLSNVDRYSMLGGQIS